MPPRLLVPGPHSENRRPSHGVPACNSSRLKWSLAGALWAPGASWASWLGLARTEMGLKLLSKTSVLFQRLAPSPKLDASDWQVPGVHPKRANASPSVGAYVLKTRGLPPGLMIYQSLSQQPGLSSLACRSVSADNASLTGAAECPPMSLSCPAPARHPWTLTETSVWRGSPGLNKSWQNLHYISLCSHGNC